MLEPLSCQVSANIWQSLPVLVFPLSAGFQKEAVGYVWQASGWTEQGLKDQSGTI